MHPNVCAAATQVEMQPSIPGCPVAQLAFPAFTNTAPTRPPVESKCFRPTITGAATTRLEVYIAAPIALPLATAIATSGFPLVLIPARTAPHAKPRGIDSIVETAPSVMFLLYKRIAERSLERRHNP